MRLRIFYAVGLLISLFIWFLGVNKLHISVPAGVVLIIGGTVLPLMCVVGFLADRNLKS